MGLLATRALALLLLPPGLFVILLVAGLALCRWPLSHGTPRWPRVGRALLITATLLLYLSSLPPVGNALSGLLEQRYPALMLRAQPSAAKLAAGSMTDAPQAIVILGGGRHSQAPEYGADTVNRLTLERLRYGARLARHTDLPILVSGGRPFGEAKPEAALMAEALREDFSVPVRWEEGHSRTTWENAVDTRKCLVGTDIRRIYLVTQARHMPRAVLAFRAQGFRVIPAPTGFTTRDLHTPWLLDLLPQAHALNNTSTTSWEALGLLWYRLRFSISRASFSVPRHSPQSSPCSGNVRF